MHTLWDKFAAISLEWVDGVLRVAAYSTGGELLAEFAGGKFQDMLAAAVVAVDPLLGVDAGADPRAVLEALTKDA